MKFLVTGFQPFGREKVNPAYEAVKLLPDTVMGAAVVKAEIPVVFQKGALLVRDIVRREQPDVIILVGQAGGRTCMEVERVAINCQDCMPGFPDNEGNEPTGEKIVPDGPDAYFSTLPIKAMVNCMLENSVPAKVSNSAGTYVCNELMYRLLHLLHTEFPDARGGFIHVPYATIQRYPSMASMPLEEISRGLQCAIEAAIAHSTDISAAGGEIY